MNNTKKNVVLQSGGKDSAATMLLAVEREIKFDAVFADTGNEQQATYDYVRYLADALKIDIRWVKADFSRQIEGKRKFIENNWFDDLTTGFDGEWKWKGDPGVFAYGINPYEEPKRPAAIYQKAVIKMDGGEWRWKPARKPLSALEARHVVATALEILHPTGNPFLDLCLWKGRFPSTRVAFCSQELKRSPIQWQVVMPLMDQHDEVWVWQGVRADESPSRAKLEEIEDVGGTGLFNYRPILNWTAQDCFDMLKKHNIKPNPLYLEGMGRVGCMPCVNCGKSELNEISKRYPREIERIAEWERLVSQVSKLQSATFFTSDKRGHGIHELVQWSKTARGGKQYDLITAVEQDSLACSSIYGLCE